MGVDLHTDHRWYSRVYPVGKSVEKKTDWLTVRTPGEHPWATSAPAWDPSNSVCVVLLYPRLNVQEISAQRHIVRMYACSFSESVLSSLLLCQTFLLG